MAEPITNAGDTGTTSTPQTRPRAVKKSAPAEAGKQIEILLPPSVRSEFDKFVGDNPVRKRLERELLDAIRKKGAEAATKAITGHMSEVWSEITK